MLASLHVTKNQPLRLGLFRSCLRSVSTNASFIPIPQQHQHDQQQQQHANVSKPISQQSSETLDAPLLNRIKSAFPDSSSSRHLHSRINLLLSKDSTIRVGIVPLQPFSQQSNTLQQTTRREIKTVLDAILSDPLSSDQKWQTALKDRNLSKNCVVSYAPTFDGSTITHNSIVEYEVPFSVSKEGLFENSRSNVSNGPANIEEKRDGNTQENKKGSQVLTSADYSARYQNVGDLSVEQNNILENTKHHMSFLEMTSPNDSLQHMLRCHRLIYVTSDPTDASAVRADPSRYLPVSTPHRVLVDYPLEKLKYTATSTVSRIEKDTLTPVISSEMQMKANELLAESPSQNADQYVNLHARANFAAMNRAAFLFSTPHKYSKIHGKNAKNKSTTDDTCTAAASTEAFYEMCQGARTPKDIANLRNAQIELAQTVLHTCKEVVDNADDVTNAIAKENAEVSIRRKKWAVEAHTELQTSLASHLDSIVADQMPWYKLYWKVDDVYSIVDEVFLRYYFLPRAQDRYKYLQGRIDQFADLHNLPIEVEASETGNNGENSASPSTTPAQSTESDISSVTTITRNNNQGSISQNKTSSGSSRSDTSLKLFDYARAEILATAGTDLHNTALRTVLVSLFGVQLPLIAIPLGAIYYFDIVSLYAAGSAIVFGVGVGFARLRKQWNQATNKFKAAVLEFARLSVNKAERELFNRWEARVAAQERVTKKRKELIQELENALDRESEK